MVTSPPKNPDELSWNDIINSSESPSRSRVLNSNSNQTMLHVTFIQLTEKSGVLGFYQVLLRKLRFFLHRPSLVRFRNSNNISPFSLCKISTGILAAKFVVNLQANHTWFWNYLWFTIGFDSFCLPMQQCLARTTPSTIPKPESESTPDNLSEVCGEVTNTYNFELVYCKRASGGT